MFHYVFGTLSMYFIYRKTIIQNINVNMLPQSNEGQHFVEKTKTK